MSHADGLGTKRFSVAYVNFFDNLLTQEIVEAETEIEARWKHSKFTPTEDDEDSTKDMTNVEFQEWCFNADTLISVIEI